MKVQEQYSSFEDFRIHSKLEFFEGVNSAHMRQERLKKGARQALVAANTVNVTPA